MNSNEPAIQLVNVHRRYGAGEQAFAALNGLDLSVEAGEFVSVMGPSGAGKSTLLNLMAGLDTPSEGRVFLGGHDLSRLSDDARSDLRLRSIGFVFQTFNLFPTFSILQNVAWPLGFLGVRRQEAHARAVESLEQLGVNPRTYARLPAELSGGEQQRVAIARALVTRPSVLLADEPTGNLDSRMGRIILDLLRRLNSERGVTVVLVTHNTLAATYGHRTVELRDGRLVRETCADTQVGAARVTTS
jgi:putative ABC transport system ATP-binding protein